MKVLVVVDYQYDFVVGALGFPKAKCLDEGIAAKMLDYAKNNPKSVVICTLDSHGEDYMQTEEGKNLPVIHCIKGTNGHVLYGEVAIVAEKINAVKLEKPTFPSEKLYKFLQELDKKDKELGGNGVEEIELCGIVTNMCVISNVVVSKMALPNAHIKLCKSLCASFDDVMHDKAIDVMASMQVEVVD